LALDIQTATTTITLEQVVTISGGSCPLTDALDECSQNATAPEQAAIQVLIQDITILINAGYSFAELLVQISLKFEVGFRVLQSSRKLENQYSGVSKKSSLFSSFSFTFL
jgi:hypothetical protein